MRLLVIEDELRIAEIEAGLAGYSGCPRLRTYWHYHGCRYDKGSQTCAEPDYIARCPLPRHDLRNGRLNKRGEFSNTLMTGMVGIGYKF